MLTDLEMLQIAEQYISFMSNEIELTIYYSATIEKPYGNIYTYDSKRHTETGDFKYSVVRGPFLVEKETGRVVNFGTAYPKEYYFEQYEKGELALSLDRYWYPEDERFDYK